MHEGVMTRVLSFRAQSLFKSELRDMPEDDIKRGLVTRRWMDGSDRESLSWREVCARYEIERRQRPASTLHDFGRLEVKIKQLDAALGRYRRLLVVLLVVAVAAQIIPNYELIVSAAMAVATWFEPLIDNLRGLWAAAYGTPSGG